MALYEDMQELIGNTPLVRLNHLDLPDDVKLYAKLELFNPSGSVKDRIGKYMIEDAKKKVFSKKAVRLLRQRQEIQVLESHLRHSTEDIKLYLSFLRSFHRKNRLC